MVTSPLRPLPFREHHRRGQASAGLRARSAQRVINWRATARPSPYYFQPWSRRAQLDGTVGPVQDGDPSPRMTRRKGTAPRRLFRH